ncbi:universal stress protein [Geminicoccaceae bacterium 1502E]|nr:universal stress protein [Geminicoccaceae bacterium 1502E]
MYRTIMVPVDLAHVDRLRKALATAADLARHYGIPVCYVGVTAATPGSVAHNPEEFAVRLDAFARSEAASYGHTASAKACTSHDPSVDLDKALMQAIRDTGADLVVMASHVPGLPDHIFASNAGWLASHAAVSVLVVR